MGLIVGWRLVRIGAIAGLGACAGGGEDTAITALPPADSGGRLVEDTGRFPFETGADTGPTNEVPTHSLLLSHTGLWTLGGPSASPTSMTGALEVREVLDGATETCLQTYALVGTRAAVDCIGCTNTFYVEHTTTDTTGECRAPELPESGELRSLGYGEAEGQIWWDYNGTGVWVAIYDAGPGERSDELWFAYEATVGVGVEE